MYTIYYRNHSSEKWVVSAIHMTAREVLDFQKGTDYCEEPMRFRIVPE